MGDESHISQISRVKFKENRAMEPGIGSPPPGGLEPPLGMKLGWYPFNQIKTPCPHFQIKKSYSGLVVHRCHMSPFHIEILGILPLCDGHMKEILNSRAKSFPENM